MGRHRRIDGAVGLGEITGARSSQQDSLLVERLEDDGSLLAIVADGMGGHAEGALASRVAAEAFRDAFVSARAHRCALERAFDESLDAANRAVEEAQRGHPEREGMGTTLLAAHLAKGGVTWISVGDSLLLLHTGAVLRRLNDDHSMRAMPDGAGMRGNMLRSAVTGGPIALVDRQADPVRLRGNDRLLLATDGVLTIPMDGLSSLLRSAESRPAQAVADDVLAAVDKLRNPRQDNCTVIVLDGPAAREESPRPPRSVPRMVLTGLGLALAGVFVVMLFFW